MDGRYPSIATLHNLDTDSWTVIYGLFFGHLQGSLAEFYELFKNQDIIRHRQRF